MTGFGVPFKINNSDGRFIEVHLYVSKDRGKSWQFHDRKNPDATEFPYYSQGDGEYWFALKTLDRDRKLHPDGNATAELKVIVDTRRPVLDLAVKTDAAGRVVCKWRAQDQHLSAKTLQIDYQPANIPNAKWTSLEYRPTNVQPGAKVHADQLAWWPASTSQEIVVRLKVADNAGNEISDQRTVVVPKLAMRTSNSSTARPAAQQNCPGGVCKTPSPDVLPGPLDRLAQGIAGFKQSRPPRVGSVPEYADPPAPSMKADFVTASAKKPFSLEPNPQKENRAPAVASNEKAVEWGSETMQAQGLNRQTVSSTQQGRGAPRSAQPTNPNRILGSGAIRSGFAQNEFAENNNRQTSGTELATIAPRQDANTGRGNQNRDFNQTQPVAGPNRVPSSSNVPDLSDRLANAKIKTINSRKFLLNYNVDAVDPSGVGKVVLWITRDAGETWKSWANDNDTASPFPVEMDENGTYGFRVVIHSNDGLSGNPPRRGDEADMWVRIDTEAPTARILSAPYGTGTEAGLLVINWEASDEQLRTKPIKLAYSTQAQGPWTTIEEGIRNTGRYAWRVGRDAPDRLYLRMEVTDAAGNVTIQQLTRPIDVSGLVPRGRINGVQPIVTQ
jgi:hypothetical protein